MRCHAVIAITVRYGTGNEELNAGADALRMRYTARMVNEQPVEFINIIADAHDYQSVVAGSLQLNEKPLKDVVENGGRVGLYWCVHGNVQETKPPISDLAATTATIINQFQLPLHKINVSACFSAGTGAKKGKFPIDDVRTSMLSEFCRQLAKACKPEAIDGLMVAGYRALIVMYHSPDQGLDLGANAYFKKMKTTTVLQGAHNTYQGGDGALSPTHPYAPASHDVTAAGELAQQLRDAKTDKLRVRLIEKNKNTPAMKLLNELELYILSKLVLRFNATTRQWTFTTIAEYSENPNVKQMVTAIGWNVRSEFAARVDIPL